MTVEMFVGGDIWPLPPLDYPDYESEGWILDEDRAVRDLMKGMVVTDQENRQRHVEAWFGHPDQELREQKYPYVTVDLINIQEGLDRVHRGDLHISDPPAWWNLRPLLPWQVGYLMEMPTPVDLDYQISTWARNPRHDRQLLTQMITGGRTMLRGGLLYTADKKIRRLDLLSHTKRDTFEDNKRLFNNIFRIRVSSEIPWGIVTSTAGYFSYGEVTSIHMSFEAKLASLGVDIGTVVIETAEIASFNLAAHSADIILDEVPVMGVPVVRYVAGLEPGDIVSVSKKRETKPEYHNLLVLGLEKKAEQ